MAEIDVFAVSGLCYAYGEKPALRGVDVRLSGGRYYGIVGPNGCGKTTLLDLLAGVSRPQAGEILFHGRPLRAYARRELARSLAYLPQDYRVNFPFTVAEVALMGRHPYLGRFASPTSADWEAVDAALAAMELEALRDAPVTALSGGEKQRAALARGLAQATPVLLLDEPTASLDIRHCLDVQRLLRARVRQEGHTVVAAMHDLNLAAGFCDELVVLAAGAVYAVGPVAAVLTSATIAAVFGVEAQVIFENERLRVAFSDGGVNALS